MNPSSPWRPALLLAPLPFLACSSSDEQDCSIPGQNREVYALMKDVYFWEDRTPDIDPLDYESPEAVLEAMAYRELDHWSGIGSAAPHQALFQEGKALGIGVRLMGDESGDLRLSLIEGDSPAERAGLERGMTLLAINGKTVQEINEQNLWPTIQGPEEPGVVVNYEVEALDGTRREVSLTKDWITLDTVLKTDVLRWGDLNVGYLLLTGFLVTSDNELRQAFASFKEQGIRDIVLDLRYNGGGLVSTAVTLASLFVGPSRDGDVFAKTVHNARHASSNEALRFHEEKDGFAVSRLVALTSGGTASASESLLNGLEPYMSVQLVGSRTHGKPVGSNAWYFCDKVISPITFQVVNADGNGDYFGGIEPDCEASDDLSHELGDPEEAQLRSALTLLETGQCAPPALAEKRAGAPGAGLPVRRSRLDELGVF